jgi:hypothetical protein
MANLDVERFLSTSDPIEVGVMERVAHRVRELQALRDENLAILIANKVVVGLGLK